MRQILRGEKALIPLVMVKTMKVPHYDEVSAYQILNLI